MILLIVIILFIIFLIYSIRPRSEGYTLEGLKLSWKNKASIEGNVTKWIVVLKDKSGSKIHEYENSDAGNLKDFTDVTMNIVNKKEFDNRIIGDNTLELYYNKVSSDTKLYTKTVTFTENDFGYIVDTSKLEEADIPKPEPIDCQGKWSNWGDCSKPCGGGKQSRYWTTTTQPQNGGAACPSPSTETRDCNTQGCKVDCKGYWNSWSACSKTCGGGTQSRTWKTTTQPQNGGAACPATQTQSCNTQGCKVNCGGYWNSWSACSKNCGGGTQTRTWRTTTQPQNGGAACPTTQTRSCNTQKCGRGGGSRRTPSKPPTGGGRRRGH